MRLKADTRTCAAIARVQQSHMCSNRTCAQFQFQIGAIKRSCNATIEWGIRLFQFQIGVIRSKIVEVERIVEVPFQFQIGAIRSAKGDNDAVTSHMFQFQIGAIRRSDLSLLPIKL